MLREAGLTGVVSLSRPDEPVGKGNVANQIQTAGTEVGSGTEVELALSLGPEDRPVPNLVGYPVNGALTLLQRAGLGFTALVEASEQPVGTVLRTQPSAGEKRPKGATVTLVLSGGPTPRWDAELLTASAVSQAPVAIPATGGEQAIGTVPDAPTAPRPTIPASPPATQAPAPRPPATSPPTTRPPAPPTTRPPRTQPSGPQCITYPARTYWDEVELRWVRVPGTRVCI